MAEICLKCWNALNETKDPAWKYILSRELDFCEECEQWTRVIVMERTAYYRQQVRRLLHSGRHDGL